MIKTGDLDAREIVRQSRTAGVGKRTSAGSGGTPAPASATTTKVDSQGRVRRLWAEGLPWDETTYFGSE